MDNRQNIPITFTGTIEVSKGVLQGLLQSIMASLPTPNPAAVANQSAVHAVTKSGLPRLAYSVHETADVLGVSYMTVHRLLRRGLLKSSGAVRHKMIALKEIERFLRETTTCEYE